MQQTKDKINVLGDEHSFIRLVDWVGDELSIVNAARVSFHNESEWQWDWGESVADQNGTGPYLNPRDKGLLNFLLKNKHGSPFEQGFMAQFHIRLPIFVMREWVRHRVGFSINEESGRYVEMRPDFFIPDHIRTQHGKPGDYWYEVSDDETLKDEFIGRLQAQSQDAYNQYKWALEQGIAKEQARLFLPLNLYTECRWTCNARSLMNFLALRNAKNAMEEIRLYAEALEDIFSQHMPNVYQSFVENGRVAP